MTCKFLVFLSFIVFPAITFAQSVNLADGYIRPQLMSSSDGRGGSTSTYFHFHGNQIEKINEKFNAHESYTIIDRKEVKDAVYYTVKGNNKGAIYRVIIRQTRNSKNQVANELIFESQGEFSETYMGF